ncbi:hypothetical protein OG21DRAFT_1443452 [Imleria badia]|nr:hypothetical protein OG21DRAFT_1443452 [Imleria badia]
MWRVEDGKQMANMKGYGVQCLAASQDGRWIAGGTSFGDVLVWDAKTGESVFSRKEDGWIKGVDFSPDSTRFVLTKPRKDATVWDIATCKQVLTLDHSAPNGTTTGSHTTLPAIPTRVTAAKYSPQGDRIATATGDSVRIWDSNDGRLLFSARVRRMSEDPGHFWFNNHLTFAAGDRIRQINASTGSTIFELPIPLRHDSCIALPRYGEFIAYSTNRTVTLWDTSTYTQLSLIQHPQDIHSIAVSPDGQFLAIGEKCGKITIKKLSHIAYQIPITCLYPSFQEPVIQIDDAALNLWRHDQLADSEALLTAAIPTPQRSSHHALASRALVRARLQLWNAAVDDAEKSIKIRPSIIGHIAKSVALVGKGEKHKAYRACDIAFDHFHPSRSRFVLLIKAIIVFMAGEYEDAISRVDDLIAMVCDNSICYVVQAYMHLLLGNLRMESRDHESAIRSFEHARVRMRPHTSQALLAVSLMTGWKFDNFGITIRQHLCKAQYAAGHAKQAGESLLNMTHLLNEEVYICKDITQWVSDFAQQCLATPESSELIQRCPTNPQSDNDGASRPSPLLIEWAKATLMMNRSWTDALTASVDFITPRFMTYQAICERLEVDHILDASKCFLQGVNGSASETTTRGEQAEWVFAFRQRAAEKLEHLGDLAVDAQQLDDAITQYSAALSLDPPIPHIFIKRSKVYMAKRLWKEALDDAKQAITLDPSSWGYEKVLMEWTKANLMNGFWKDALSAARDFKVPKLTIYRNLCEGLELETVEGIMDAIECFHQMASELTEETITRGEQVEWFLDFRYRCSDKLELFGDAAMDSQRHDEALKYYLTALSIHPTNTQRFFILQSKVGMTKGLWKDALDHAYEAIAFDPASPWGYEAERAALHGAGRYDEAIQTFETMLSKMAQSPDPQICERRGQYVTPSTTRVTIRKIVQRTMRQSPCVLINTTTGRLYNKTEQTTAFMSLPIVSELVSSMTTRIDRGRIKREARKFFQYVMLSHKWEENEPLFQQVIHVAVYDLDQSPTHDKLQMFCRIVRDAGFNWAWSDTCCINKEDHFVLQEALVAMFKWYRGSVMTIVYLQGVRSPATLGDLVRSIWNTRAWTLREYVAAKVIRFYTEDWTPYLNLDTPNHKESPEIISEMEQATGVSAQQLTALRSGLGNIREKLHLASTRHTTLVEDVAYSLLGIFSVVGIPAIYGEGEGALGRLLAHILAGSGDASILAWTGQSSTFNSCLPAYITVFNRSAMSHLPRPIENAEMEKIVTRLRTSTLELDVSLRLYDRLNELPASWFAASRMKLPCIAFKLPPLLPYRTDLGPVYRVESPVFGKVEIKSKQVPSRLDSLYLVHPWLDALLGREEMHSGVSAEDDIAEPSSPNSDDEDLSDEDEEDDSSPKPLSHPAPVDTAPVDRETHAWQLVARLRQPFGALLFTLAPTRRRAVEYRRVAADSVITVQIQENVALTDVLDNVRTLDVL